MTTRRTLYITGPNQVELLEEPLPALQDHEMLVETECSLISTGTEGIIFSRNFTPDSAWARWVKYPFQAGYLNAGTITALGKNVPGWKVGDRVASRANHSSHVIMPAVLPCSHTGVRAPDAMPIPDGLAEESAVWMGLGRITQVGVRAARPELGDTVALVGLGLLGQLVAQYARLSGAGQVIAIDTAPRRLEMAAAHGATHTLRMTAAEALPRVLEITHGKGVDVVYDMTGHAQVFATVLPLARKFGTVVLLGSTGQPLLQTLTSDVIGRGLRIVGAHDQHAPVESTDYCKWSATDMYELFLNYLARGQMRVDDLITHRYRPEQAPEAYRMLQHERDTAMGVLFEWKGKGGGEVKRAICNWESVKKASGGGSVCCGLNTLSSPSDANLTLFPGSSRDSSSESMNINIFKSFTLRWWEAGIFKALLLSLGLLIGSTWPEIFLPWRAVLGVVFLVSTAYTCWIWAKQ